MTHTVGELKASVAGLLQGINLENVTEINAAIERAARTVLQQADVPEASGRTAITLYDKVFDYSAPTTIFGGALNDLRPQGISRTPLDVVYKQPIELFDRTKALLPNGYQVTFEYDNGTPIFRVAQHKAKAAVVLDAMNDTTGWVAAGSASALVADATVFYQSPASLRFTLTGSSTGTLEKTLTNALDLSEYEDVGVAFLAIRIPDGATASTLTSLALRLGSSSSDYDEVSETEGFLGAWVSGDWLLVAFDFAGSTGTGTPDWDALDYVQVRLAHTATLTNFRVGYLLLALPSPHEMLYQSSAIFSVSGTLSQTITTDGDTIILTDPAYQLLEFESALTVAFQQGGTLADANIQYLRAALHGAGSDIGLYAMYRGDNPSQELRSTRNYYDD